ncbi:hypothetical protein [Williamsia sterculiae]|uniref:Helix-turn-helix domain-containing protein n=1 Tax=Williamsia sterculiae TaxID=1344003 RepID=A0A1N7FE55_9NOCA|nr:hypothetical protein [Williamsia sterculiae]SIR98611.1 hypothetical protein SAMN05445060_1980 [Williamsia sterculiae]
MSARALGGAVLVEGTDALRAMKFGISAAARERRRNGMNPGPALAALLQVCDEALSHNGHQDRPDPLVEEPSPVEVIDSATAAELTGYTRRHICRIGDSLGGQRLANGTWHFRRGAVEDYVRARDATRRSGGVPSDAA